jgi:uncharacterized protein (TIGR02217 family)
MSTLIPFSNVRFPEDISYGSKGGPSFSTSVFTATSGYEQRNSNWSTQRCTYNVVYGIRTIDQMARVFEFFYAMRGKALAFRFKDWTDYRLKDEKIGVGNGAILIYQITKTYTVGLNNYVRELKKIVPNVDAPITVKINGTTLAAAGYTIDIDTGKITFVVAPPAASIITITCEFDVPVRFDIDSLPVTLEEFEIETMSDIPLVEIRLS